MGRHKNSDLADFSDWLEQAHCFAPRTASTYTSAVRGMLASMELVSTEGLDTYLSEKRHIASYRASWKRFAEWAATRGVGVPMPTATYTLAHGKERVAYAIPGSVCDDIIELAKGGSIPVTLLAQMKWGLVDKILRAGAWEIADPASPGTFFRIPIKATQRLEAWAFPHGAEENDPLVPTEPSSPDPMPYRALMRLLASRRRSHRHN